jgi:hypothetical protein
MPSSVLLTDDFTGSDGTAPDSAKWDITHGTTGSVVVIDSDQLKVQTGALGGHRDTARAIARTAPVADVRVQLAATPAPDDTEKYAAIVVRGQAIDETLQTSGYHLYLEHPGYFRVEALLGSNRPNISGPSTPIPGYAPGVPVNVDFSIAGTTLTVYVWTGSVKPASPSWTGTDTATTSAGYVGLCADGGDPSGQAVYWWFDDVQITDLTVPLSTSPATVTAVPVVAVADAPAPAVAARCRVFASPMDAGADGVSPLVSGRATIGAPAGDAAAEGVPPLVAGRAVVAGVVGQATAEFPPPVVLGRFTGLPPPAGATAGGVPPVVAGRGSVVAPSASAVADAPPPSVDGGNSVRAQVNAVPAAAAADMAAPAVAGRAGAPAVAAAATADATAPVVAGRARVTAPPAAAAAGGAAPRVAGRGTVIAVPGTATATAGVPVVAASPFTPPRDITVTASLADDSPWGASLEPSPWGASLELSLWTAALTDD